MKTNIDFSTTESSRGKPADLEVSKERTQCFGGDRIDFLNTLSIFTEYQLYAGRGVRTEGVNALPCSLIMFEFEGVPIWVISGKQKQKQPFSQNNNFNLVPLCFKTNALRCDSEVLKYNSHLNLTPVEFSQYSVTTRVLMEALRNTSGQFHYLMALGFSNASY